MSPIFRKLLHLFDSKDAVSWGQTMLGRTASSLHMVLHVDHHHTKLPSGVNAIYMIMLLQEQYIPGAEASIISSNVEFASPGDNLIEERRPAFKFVDHDRCARLLVDRYSVGGGGFSKC